MLLFVWPPTLEGADFYVSPRGRDDATGTSRKDPWRTIRRVNEHLRVHGLRPGDSIRFQGGSVFDGGLVIDEAGGGTESQPVLIGTYGPGRATVRAGTNHGVLLRETPWITVSNLVLIGRPDGNGDGIRADRTKELDAAIPGIAIVNCEARDFAWHGVMIDASQRSRGYERVRIERCVASGNRHAGIMVYGGNPIGRDWRPHARILVQACVARHNPGDPSEFRHHSGSGIVLDGVDSGLIRRCVAFGNGRECRSERGGPVGIWTHASRSIVIEYCESYDNRSCLRDGGGFDLDAGSEECVLRYNFSHHNHGPGFLIYTYSGAAYSDRSNQMYGNISWNDGFPSTGYGGIQIGSEPGCWMKDLRVHHNLVIAPPRSVAALKVVGHGIEALIASNLVVAAPHGVLVSVSGFDHSIRFQGNRYWRPDGVPVHLVDNLWAIASLASWKNATGPDFRFTSVAEVFGDPGLCFRLPGARHRASSAPRWPEVRLQKQPWPEVPELLLTWPPGEQE